MRATPSKFATGGALAPAPNVGKHPVQPGSGRLRLRTQLAASSASVSPSSPGASRKLCSQSRAYFPPNDNNLFVRPALDDPPVIEHQNLIRPHDRREPMRDHDTGPMKHQILQRLLDQPLRRGVHARGRLVENQNRRILQEAPARSRVAAFRPRSTSPRARPPRCRVRSADVR